MNVAVLVLTSVGAAASTVEEYSLPEVSFEGLLLKDPVAITEASRALSVLGGLAVLGVRSDVARAGVASAKAESSQDWGKASRQALEAWSGCLRPGGAAREASRHRQLAAGELRRVSVAASGRWDEDDIGLSMSDCRAAHKGTVSLRAGVRQAVHALASALNAAEASTSVEQRRMSRAKLADVALAEAVQRGSRIEHLHLYEEVARDVNASRSEGIDALDLHTDAGLLLAFVPPAVAEGAGGRAANVEVQLPGGEIRALAPPSQADAVIFFVGEAAKLLRSASDSPLRPMPHALRLRRGFGWRAWYGAMVLPPDDAAIGLEAWAGAGRVASPTFGEFWRAAKDYVSRQPPADAPAIGCGGGLRLADQGGCGEGEIECWMTCMSVAGLSDCRGGMWRPKGVGDLAEWVNLSIQCLDPKTGKKWPDQTSQMCPSCQPACALSAVGPEPPSPTPDGDEEFCRTTGDPSTGVTMYMDGFRFTSVSSDEACVNFLLPSLVIDSPWKLALACVGVVLLSACVEMTHCVRRRLPARRQGDIGVIFHMIGLCFAYVAMLFVMTYSVELFCSVIVGLAIGHHAASRLSRSKRFDLGAGSPCCRLSQGLDATGERTPTATGEIEAALSLQDAEAAVRLSVKDMTCGACTETVRRALVSVDGVLTARVSLQDATAYVWCRDPAPTSQDLCAAAEMVGFEASVIDTRS